MGRPVTLPMVLRHEQVRLFVQISRFLRRLIRAIAWDRLSTPERRRLRRSVERLESDLILARILAGASDKDCEQDTQPRHETSPRKNWSEEDDEV